MSMNILGLGILPICLLNLNKSAMVKLGEGASAVEGLKEDGTQCDNLRFLCLRKLPCISSSSPSSSMASSPISLHLAPVTITGKTIVLLQPTLPLGVLKVNREVTRADFPALTDLSLSG